MTASQAFHKLLFSGAVPAKISRPFQGGKKFRKRRIRLFEYLISSFSLSIFSGPVWTPSLPPCHPTWKIVGGGGRQPCTVCINWRCLQGRAGFMLSVQWMTALLARVVEDERGPYLFPTPPPPPPLAAHYVHDVLRATQSPPPFCQKRSFAFGRDNALPIPQ